MQNFSEYHNKGTFISASITSFLEIENSTFLNGISEIGGAISIEGSNLLKTLNNTFQNCNSLFEGGAIYASLVK